MRWHIIRQHIGAAITSCIVLGIFFMLAFWDAPTRWLLAQVPPGWALGLTIVTGLLLGLLILLLPLRLSSPVKPLSIAWISFYLLGGLLYATIIYLSAGTFFHSAESDSASAVSDLHVIFSCAGAFIIFLGTGLIYLNRWQRERREQVEP